MVTNTEDQANDRIARAQTEIAQLFEQITLNERDENQCNQASGSYSREYMYNVRDVEQLFKTTACPLPEATRQQLGVCRSLIGVKAEPNQQAGRVKRAEWPKRVGRSTAEDKALWNLGNFTETDEKMIREGSNLEENRLNPLHRSAQPWREAMASLKSTRPDHARDRILLWNVRTILNKITPATEEALTRDFLELKIYQSTMLNEIVRIFFDKATEDTHYRKVYARLCYKQIADELRANLNVSEFRNALLARAQKAFDSVSFDRKVRDIDAYTDQARKRTFRDTMFIGHLHLVDLVSGRVIVYCVYALLASVLTTQEQLEGHAVDEEAVECVVRLIELIGNRVDEDRVQSRRNLFSSPIPLDTIIGTLETAMGLVRSQRLRFAIENLVELRANGWKTRTIDSDGVSKSVEQIKEDIDVERISRAARKRLNEVKAKKRALIGISKANIPDIHAISPSGNAVSKTSEIELTEREQIQMLTVNCLHLSRQVTEWKDKYEEMEKKYRKLLIMIGRGKQTTD